jgi:hypothetical protein
MEGLDLVNHDPFVKAAQDAGFCLFCAISHRAKLSQRSSPDGWVTLPGKAARDSLDLHPAKFRGPLKNAWRLDYSKLKRAKAKLLAGSIDSRSPFTGGECHREGPGVRQGIF